MATTFRQLNGGWNAEPNAPNPTVLINGDAVVLRFGLNHFVFPDCSADDLGELTFHKCWRFQLGSMNDEGWYRGQCRFSKLAPKWGEFYEVEGDLRLDEVTEDWTMLSSSDASARHFLFYLRDETFECDAQSWSFRILRGQKYSLPN
jgi:hypothetical protein